MSMREGKTKSSIMTRLGEQEATRPQGPVSTGQDIPRTEPAQSIINSQENYAEEVDAMVSRIRLHLLESHALTSQKLTQEYLERIHDAETAFVKNMSV